MKNLICVFICCAFSPILIFSQKNIELDECDMYISKSNYLEAIKCIQQNKDDIDSRKKLLFCYKKIEDYSKAIIVLKELISEDINNTQLITDLAETYQEEGDFENSLNCYNKLYSKDTTNVYFQLKQAELLFLTENYLQSIILYGNIYNQNADMTSCLKNIANNYKMLHKTDSALIYFRKAFQADQRDAMSALNLMSISINDEAYDEAVNIGSSYIANNSTNKKINLLHSYALYKKEDYLKAIAGFKISLAEGDSSLMVNRSLGSSYFKIGKDSLAYHYLNIAYTQDTLNNNVLYQLAMVSRDLDKKEESINHLNKLLERTLSQETLIYHYYKELSEIYFDEQKYNESLDYAILSLQYANTNQKIRIYFKIADLYEHYLGSKETAITYYKKYIDSTKIYLEENKENLSEEEIDNIKNIIKKYEI